MDLLRAGDQMDLASSPGMPPEDVDFELDDVREVSTEPNQDLMSQDALEQPVVDTDVMRSLTSDHADDDLMLDEDTTIQQENDADLLDLTDDIPQDERAQVDEDDDILYEDEEYLQEHEGRPEDASKEQEMEAIDAEGLQVNHEVQIFDTVEDELQAAADIDVHADEESPRFADTESTSEKRQTHSAEDAVNANNDGKAKANSGSTATVYQEPNSGSLENVLDHNVHDGDANEKYNQAEIEVIPNNDLDLGGDATAIHDSNPQSPKASENSFQAGALESDTHPYPRADSNTVREGDFGESALQSPLLHPVKVHYLETELCLFPPTEDDEPEMFFLDDVSLAHESLDKMLSACRDVLANTIGQDDELVLDVASLGLHISEGSSYATGITLSQIIDVYVALAHNDNVTSIEPLYCSLSSRVCLASQYAYLQSAVNEGKTLTQIIDENTFAPAKDGEDGGDGLEYEQAEIWNQETSAETKDTDESNPVRKGEDALPTLKHEPNEEVRKAKVSSPARGSSHESEGRPLDGSGAGPNEDKVGELKNSVQHDQEQSATSTVKGDSEEFEDTAAVVFDKDELTEDLFSGTAHPAEDSRPIESSTAAGPKDVGEPDGESNRQNSVSSRTLEAESNQLEEDMFSPNNDQTLGDEHGNFTETQDDDVEDFELGEQNFEDAGLEVDDSHCPKPDTGSEHHNPDLAQMAPSSDLDLINDVDARNQMLKVNQKSTRVEVDDELLNFDDDEDEDEGKEGNQGSPLSAHRPKVSENGAFQSHSTLIGFTRSADATGAHHNELNSFAKDSSSKATKRHGSHSPLGQLIDTSTEPAEDAPTTPSGGKSGFKRKALEDEDDFDLFDTATPDKKRRRPS